MITRSGDAGGEDHEPATVDEFAALRGSGAFALSWEAHGQAYGIRRVAAEALAAGVNVVANGSRAVVAEARERFAPVRILLVTAAPAMLAARIAHRGRESGDAILARLERARADAPSGADVVPIVNDGPLEQAVDRFVSALLVEGQTTAIS